MSETSWQDECHAAAAQFSAGDHASAAQAFENICARTDLGSSDKSIMPLNLATIYEKMNRVEDALGAFDRGRVESLQNYLYIQQSRAVMLIRVGRLNEAIEEIQQLLKNDALNADGRDACESNLRHARQMLTGSLTPVAAAEIGKPAASTHVPSTARYSEAPRSTL